MKFSQKLSGFCSRTGFLAIMIFVSMALSAQSQVDRIDPPFWWTGMKHREVQLLFHGNAISDLPVSLIASHTKMTGITRLPNPNYLLITIDIAPEQPEETVRFEFGLGRKKFSVNYEIRKREEQRTRGLSPSDCMYLVFPDRFANGDPANDNNVAMQEPAVDRAGLKTRHGGDLAGISNHLDYLSRLGATALWLNPVLENNEPRESYHGYAATDLYKVDPRLGTNEQYRQLVRDCHKKGMKVVWDVVYNHWGDQHHLYRDLPDSAWIHWFPQFTRTSYRAETLLDPYASQSDKKLMADAWFDTHMPDLNQQDPVLATYLIQNSIWWIEYAGLDAFRIDTYAYPDQLFMKKLNEAILKEYPDFFLFGETWVQGSPIQAWFTQNTPVNSKYSSSLHGVTDFQLYYAITQGLNEPFGWSEGLRRIQLTLSHDILYEDPYRNVTFLDNHDLNRIHSVFNQDFNKWKISHVMLMTLRGIPCVYYGTEILMTGVTNPDALVRADFPGGWIDDPQNKFDAAGRTDQENEAWQVLARLMNWRKQNPWLGTSDLVQFVPDDNTWVYFRKDDGHTVMVVINLNAEAKTIDLSRFAECIGSKTTAKDVIFDRRVLLSGSITAEPSSAMVLELY